MLQDISTDIYGGEIAFDGNPNLKRSGTKLGYTKEHIEEYLKCAKDVFYFAENYYKILSLTDGMITPKLRDYQHDMIKSYINNRFSLILATRQCVTGDTLIKVRNKKTGIVEEITMEKFKEKIIKSKS